MFGLAVSAPFELVGMTGNDAGDGGLPFELSLRPEDELLAERPADAERLSDRRDAAGETYLRVDYHPSAGTFMQLRGEGAFRITADARRAELAPAHTEPWRWQRLLVGQVLPYGALLNGLEVLHASAVLLDGRLIAIAGGSHAGKSTLATHWLAQGAALVADDVVALETAGTGPPTVHPGPSLLSVRAGTRELVGDGAVDALGTPVGADEEGTRISVRDHASAPAPLGALVVLRRDEARSGTEVARTSTPDPRLILGSTFNFVVHTPERLTAHLDLAARIFASVPVVVADVGTGVSPAELAGAIESELEAAP